jgi:hypothetical protein
MAERLDIKTIAALMIVAKKKEQPRLLWRRLQGVLQQFLLQRFNA